MNSRLQAMTIVATAAALGGCGGKKGAKAAPLAAAVASGSGAADGGSSPAAADGESSAIGSGESSGLPSGVVGASGDGQGAGAGLVANVRGARGDAKGLISVRWSAVQAAANYRVYLAATDECVDSGDGPSATTRASSATLEGAAEGRYFACVRALNAGGDAVAGGFDPAAVIADWTPPGAFAVKSPAGFVGTMAPHAEWSEPEGGVVRYRLQVARDDSCSDVVGQVDVATGTSADLPAVPGVGTYALCIVASDAAGNTSRAKSSFQVLAAKPTVSFVGLTDGSYVPITALASYRIVGACSEPNRDVVISGAVSATVACGSSQFFSVLLNLSALNDGPVILHATQADVLGAVSDAATVTLVKDSTPPAVAVSGVPTGTTQLDTFSVHVQGSDVAAYRAAHGAGSLNCELIDLSAWTPAAEAFAVSAMQSGMHTLCISGRDAAGNVAPTITRLTWTLDRAPSVTFGNPAPSAALILGRTFTINFNATDLEEDALLTFYAGNASANACTNGQLSGYTLIKSNLHKSIDHSFTWKPLATGAYRICAKADDGVNAPVYVASEPVTVLPNTIPTFAFTNLGVGAHPITYRASYSISYNAVDPDDDAAISLYFRQGSAGGCTNGTLTGGWYPLTEARFVHDSGPYVWQTTNISYGSYYICAKIDDGVNTPVFVASAGTVVVNRAPQMTLNTPTRSSASVVLGNSYTISWVASDPDDDATISLYYAPSLAATCAGGSPIDTGISEDQTGVSGSYVLNTGNLPAAVANKAFYICAEIDDHVNPLVTRWSKGVLRIKGPPPTINLTAPAAGTQTLASAATAAVLFTAQDDTENARIDFYWNTTSTGCLLGDLSGWHAFASTNEDAPTAINLGVQAPGQDLYVCGRILNNGSQQAAFSLAPGKVRFNGRPSVSMTTTASGALPIGTVVSVTTTGLDDDDATYDIYLASDCSGTPLYSGKKVSDNAFTFDVSTTGLGAGTYNLCARASDGINPPTFSHLGASFLLYDTTCVWTGAVSASWSDAGNWTSCNGSAPRGADYADVPAGAARQPRVDATSGWIAGFKGTGGGLITVAANTTFKFTVGGVVATNYYALQASIGFVGESAACTTCKIGIQIGDLRIGSGAVLSVGSGITMDGIQSIFVGGGSEKGGLVLAGGASAANYPVLNYGSVIYVAGIDAANRSTLSVDGAYLGGHAKVAFGAHAVLSKFDRIIFNAWGMATDTQVDLGGCNDLLVSDDTWDGLEWTMSHRIGSGRQTSNVNASGCSAPVTVSGNGMGYGPAAATDPNDVITWQSSDSFTCIWTGGVSGSWTDPANWSGCANGRYGYPDAADTVTIATSAHAPVVSGGTFAVKGIVGAGGGELTIAANSYLWTAQSLQSNLTVKGDSSHCGSCGFHVSAVDNDATLILKGGIVVDSDANDGGYSELDIGTVQGIGHLELRGNDLADESSWPVIKTSASFGGIVVSGVDAGHRSSIAIDGAVIGASTAADAGAGINLRDFYELKSLNHMAFRAKLGFGSAALALNQCGHSVFTPTSWDAVAFYSPISLLVAGTYNISFANCTLDAGSVPVSAWNGGGDAFGEAFANDAASILWW